ncbi:beta-ketoacyl synthase N-terminal-like domain-containing protein [Algoriphagus chordae]|uniref:Beta-ketoacyl synthase-like protein n=1 Tax=Algoriphagus chordae TaxID=237019 RepID=A0A2W7SDL8_9BACT|nr:beta-ketoacyl synthase N-terminal-like domain-containing protein [Algoriphagus chordae]PZX48722.1 beta-ketoacyl synthase-like protein [Algoriphagus chordae]
MKPVYIHSIASISAQHTVDESVFLDQVESYEDNVLQAIDPEYKNFIPRTAARRMSKGVKMGIVASKLALSRAGVEVPDAIITGTGLGCLKDSEKFVSAIIDNKEQFLTPTSFIQSTHNTVGGQIALELQCKGYNFTYVQASVSFESALLDAELQLKTDEASNILVGGIDELGDHTTELFKVAKLIKSEKVSSEALLESKTKGVVYGEGANFFLLCNEKSENCYSELIDTAIFNTLEKEELTSELQEFLKNNQLSVDEIDAIICGYNGDVQFDDYYELLTDGVFAQTQQVYYKHLSGEYHSSSAFGFWLANKILKTQTLPKAVKLNQVKDSGFEFILLYNQYMGENHSFTLLRKC